MSEQVVSPVHELKIIAGRKRNQFICSDYKKYLLKWLFYRNQQINNQTIKYTLYIFIYNDFLLIYLADIAILHRLYIHNPVFKVFVGHQRFVFNFCFIRIDGVNGVFQNLGDLFIVMNAHSYQGKNPKIGVQQFVVF